MQEPPELGGYGYKAAGNRSRTGTLSCEYIGR